MKATALVLAAMMAQAVAASPSPTEQIESAAYAQLQVCLQLKPQLTDANLAACKLETIATLNEIARQIADTTP